MWFCSVGRDAAACSALSTAAIRSLISVPEYKPTHFRSDGVEDCSEKWRATPVSEPPFRVGEGLNCQSFQPGPVANYQGRALQADQPFFLQIT
jgi:hypothetical protein